MAAAGCARCIPAVERRGQWMLQVDAERIGERAAPRATEIEKGAIRQFALALGESDPVYFDEEIARQAGYRSLPAPPTFPATLPSNPVPGLKLPRAGLIHGEQQFVYGAPICAGDVIRVSAWLENVKVRRGSRGIMSIVTIAREGVNQEDVMVFQARSVLIANEGEI